MDLASTIFPDVKGRRSKFMNLHRRLRLSGGFHIVELWRIILAVMKWRAAYAILIL